MTILAIENNWASNDLFDKRPSIYLMGGIGFNSHHFWVTSAHKTKTDLCEADMVSPSVIVDTAMYRDYAELPTATSASGSAVDTKNNGSFPPKLHYVLKEMENDGLSHIASWAPHGRCFMIHKPDLFVEQVLKK
jgi:hypothetical protein